MKLRTWTVLITALILAPPAFADDWDACISKAPDEAIEGCIQAGREPRQNLARAYRNRGIAYGKMGEFQKSLADLSAAIERDPTFADAYYDRSLTHYNMRHARSAIADLTEAISLKPAYADAFGNRGLLHLLLGHYDLALADLDKAIALDPQERCQFLQPCRRLRKGGKGGKGHAGLGAGGRPPPGNEQVAKDRAGSPRLEQRGHRQSGEGGRAAIARA